MSGSVNPNILDRPHMAMDRNGIVSERQTVQRDEAHAEVDRLLAIVR